MIADTLLGLAATYNDMDDSASAIEVYNRMLSIIEKTRGPIDETLALPLSKMGHCLLEEERVDEAEAVLQRFVMLTFVFRGMHLSAAFLCLFMFIFFQFSLLGPIW